MEPKKSNLEIPKTRFSRIAISNPLFKEVAMIPIKRHKVLLALATFIFIGCASTLPDKISIKENYSLLNVKTCVIKAQCDKVDLDPSLSKSFAGNYCQILEGAVKMALSKTNSSFQYVPNPDEADLNINKLMTWQAYGSNP